MHDVSQCNPFLRYGFLQQHVPINQELTNIHLAMGILSTRLRKARKMYHPLLNILALMDFDVVLLEF